MADRAERQYIAVQWCKYILMFLAVVLVVLPIIVVFLGSFKTGEELNRSGPFDSPSFTSDTEIWKGGEILSGENEIHVSAKSLPVKEIRRLTFIIDTVQEDGSFISVRSGDKEVLSLSPEKGASEVSAQIERPVAQKLLSGGFSVAGSGCTVRRIKALEGFLFGNYATAFIKENMALGFLNTLIIVLFASIGTILTGSMTAFVLSRFKFKLKKVIYTMFLWIALIPTITTQVATFRIIQKLGMYNTRLSVIVLSMGTDIIAIMIYLQFLNNISVSLDESAIMDGANWWQVFSRIIFPLLQPATVTILILKVVNLYNDFYNPLLYMPKKSLMVISTSLYKFKGPFGTNWPVICAGVIIALIPTLEVFILCQKYIYNGMVSGSVKE